MAIKKLTLISFYFFIGTTCLFSENTSYPIIIIGGSASGISAGLQSARLGVKTLIVEEHIWMGGMLTSAGVSAFDGNHKIAGGIWKEFRDSLYKHYGNAKSVETGWVSNTLFEPSIGNQIFTNMARNVKDLTIKYNSVFVSAKKVKNKWNIVINENGISKSFQCDILIDASETGLVCKYLKVPSDIGMDSGKRTGESWAAQKSNDIIQDLTYVVILKDFGKGSDHSIPKPQGYKKEQFACCCDTKDPSLNEKPNIDCDKMMSYGKLPNGKYMINWPECGNDTYFNILKDNPKTQIEKLKAAKLHTLRFVYYIQTELGYRHLGIADDEFPTEDKLPFIPYHRESRRIQGLTRLQADHLVKPFDQIKKYYRAGIAVGDYPIDHHHKKNQKAPDIPFFSIKAPSYNIPMGCLIPKGYDGLIVAEKNISVSNIVNGTTRLQPVVMGIGQAAGAIAAKCVEENTQTSKLSIRKIQLALLQSDAYIMPYIDVQPTDPYFKAIQKIGATGIIKGVGVTYKWANQTWFYPKKNMSENEILEGLKSAYPILEGRRDGSGEDLKISYFLTLLKNIKPTITISDIILLLKNYGDEKLTDDTILKRLDVAIVLDQLLDPFSIEIDHDGHFINQISTIE